MTRQSGMMGKKRGSGLREYTFLCLAVEGTSNTAKLKVDQKKTGGWELTNVRKC